jgi:hypothetical protein
VRLSWLEAISETNGLKNPFARRVLIAFVDAADKSAL